MARLAVIGNISVDHSIHPESRRQTALGGAALHVALAAARAGLAAAPVSVIGDDLDTIHTDPRLAMLDLTATKTSPGSSPVFSLTYDAEGRLVNVGADYGVATGLTWHALERVYAQMDDAYHVCCRRPLDIARVLDALVRRAAAFSVDFFISSARESIAAAAPALPHAQVVFVNAFEYELLKAAVPVGMLSTIVVSDGPRLVRIFRRGQLIATAMPPATVPLEVAGAGDTLAGCFLAARKGDVPDALALERAVAAASAYTARPALPLESC